MKKNINQKMFDKLMKGLTLVALVFVMAALMITGVHAYSLSYDSLKPTLNMTYDANDRILTQKNGSESVTYVYDGVVDGTLTNISTSKGVVTRYTYDDRKRMISETKQIDSFVFKRNITYDSHDGATSVGGSSVLVTRTYGDSLLLNALSSIVSFLYNERGQPLAKVYNNNLTSNFTYAQNTSRVVEIQTGAVQNLFYGYDAYGNIVRINDTVNFRNTSLTYDALHRLIFADIQGQGSGYFNYSYNSLGNILVINSTNDNVVYAYTTLAHAPTSVVAASASLLNITALTVVYANVSERVFRFVIKNNDASSFTHVNWTLSTGNGTITSTQNIVLTSGKDIFVYVYHNYTTSGNYTAQVTVYGGAYTKTKSISVTV